MQLAVQKAQSAGIALVVVKNSQPLVDVTGIAALAANEGCLGFCAANWGKADRETSPGWLSSQPQAWCVRVADRLWASSELTSGTPAVAMGVLSLLLTAGLTDSKLPSGKKRASPFGAGTEYACLAIPPAAFSSGDALTRIGDELAASDGAAGWTPLPSEPLPEMLSISDDVRQALIEAGQTARVPFPVA